MPIRREEHVNSRLAAVLNAFLIALMFAIALWTIRELPAGAQVPTHWGPDGRPDAWSGKYVGLLFNPFLSAFLWYALSAVPQGFSLPGKLPLPAHARRAIFSCILLIQLGAESLIAIGALGIRVDTSTLISIALGILYMVIGAGKSDKPGTWVFVLCGFAIILAALGLQQDDKILAVLIFSLGAPLLAKLCSYLLGKRIR